MHFFQVSISISSIKILLMLFIVCFVVLLLHIVNLFCSRFVSWCSVHFNSCISCSVCNYLWI